MAAWQLGGDKPLEVRLAGVYAMAGLADDWEENRQTCIDLLCATCACHTSPPARRCHPIDAACLPRASREVRHTVIRVITAHLKDGAAVSWQGRDFDFTGVVFDGGDFSDAKFSGGTVYFSGAQFSGGVVDFSAQFSGGTVSFDDAKFSGAAILFRFAKFSGGTVSFGSAVFSGGTVDFGGAVDWSCPPAFPWTGTPPPGVKLPPQPEATPPDGVPGTTDRPSPVGS
jgi:hypothetical protein